MKAGKLVVFGASGLVGSALCERLFFTGEWEFVPVVRSSGGVARLARLMPGERFVFADLMAPDSFLRLLGEESVVINCARGGDADMQRGFLNLLRACRQRRVRKFVHISSVAIFGDDPPLESAEPGCRLSCRLNEYGRIKRWQDEQALKLHGQGVPTYIICPGNISGPYSPWSAGFASRLLSHPLPLVDGGRYPANVVHVDNLVEALLAAALAEGGAGERYFVNEPEPVSWKQYVEDLCRILDIPLRLVPADREEVLRRMEAPKRSAGLTEHLKIMLSGEFRNAVSMLPVMAWLNRKAAAAFESLPDPWRAAIRRKMSRPVVIAKQPTGPDLSEPWVRVQARRPFHSPASLAEKLGWRPVLTYEEGLRLTCEWLRFTGLHGSAE
jgi:nucleoside-diphosphate-sugar epimerase